VSSTISPPLATVSRTMRAVTPLAIRLVCLVTVVTTSLSLSRYTHRVPGAMGQ
jgi:hypothetical protein